MQKLASLFVAVVLSLGLFHELRITGFSRFEDGNNYSWFMFISSSYATNPQDMPANWASRNLSCALAGAWFNAWGKPDQFVYTPESQDQRQIIFKPQEQYKHCDMVASFYALFYLITCVALVGFLKKPLLPMLGTFASILCCSPAFLWPYLLPWDLPTMAVWTIIFLFYLWLKARPQLSRPWIYLAFAIILGGLFKETVLVTALFLLAAPWKRSRQIATIIITVIASQLLNWLVCGAPPDWMFSFKEGSTEGGHKWNPLLLWPALFANVGSITLLPLALWRRWKLDKDWQLPLTCAAFIGLTMINFLAWGIYNENRDWLEIAPLAWILIAEYFPHFTLKIPAKQTAEV